jgi:hypothetical protein
LSATATESTVGTTVVANLLLFRYALPNTTPKKVREDVGSLLDAGLSVVQFDELRSELVSAGFLARGPRNTFTLTDPGRERALRFLGLSELPPRATWKIVVNKHLFPKAAGLGTDMAAKLKKGDQMAAYLLRLKYCLSGRAGSSVRQVLEAIACQKLGFPEETTLDGLFRAVLSKELNSDHQLTKEQLVKQFPLFETGLKAVNADAMRRKLVQDWLVGRTVPGRDKLPHPEQLDLPAFAATVRALAGSSPPQDRFHDNKVFIAALWRASQRELNFPRLSLPEFKRRLVEANAKHLLHLSRADFVQAMDPQLVAESEITHENATFHFVLLEDARR